MNCRSSGLTDRGMLRNVNQDNLFVDPDGRLFIVADGMGGHAGGQEASRIATEVLSEVILNNWDSDEPSDDLLKAAIHKANEAILEDQDRHPERAQGHHAADARWCLRSIAQDYIGNAAPREISLLKADTMSFRLSSQPANGPAQASLSPARPLHR